ncbi:class I adenylate-forming enzyme family protein [Streptomyces mutabilis]|uniref:class I adenylate-forming enzyme family protein n=1 Tax=Streptomyces mutabilis TaxID=67332 RepID=UPI003659F357
MPNIATTLTGARRLHAERTALRYADRHLTYGELDDAVRRFASALLSSGLRPGDRVAVFAKNCPEYVITMYGAFAAGMVIVPVNAKLAGPELAVILEDSETRLLVHDAASAALVEAAAGPDLATLRIGPAFDRFLAVGDPDQQVADLDEDTVAWLFYTSGTTGRPKGAMLTHRNLTAMMWLELANVCDYRAEDVALHVTPLSHGGGLYLLGAVARGATNLVYSGSSFVPGEVLQLIEREGVTVIAFLAPTMIVMLLDADAESAADTSSLRRAVYGGAPMHLDHARRMVDRFGAVFVQIYGQGESPMTITYLDLAEGPVDDDRLISAGVPHPGVEVAVLDADDRPVAVGGTGEICVRGDTVMRGYLGNPEATAAALRNGWLHTGDVGRFDEHGRLTLLDRSKDVIISGGTNIYPREVEDALLLHPGVRQVVVFGEPDEVWGESVTAAVVREAVADVSADELIDWCRTRIAGFKKPKRVVFVDELPRNAYGKVLRREVRDRLVADVGQLSSKERLARPAM